ncbi:hypothetical protein T552_03055 [Pneumocystis carinii B80]|uniref:RecA family profile 1 domain-containing protein n=1 Tax=Pneumocystis carinii (strain B80) TaxID=1408658 RepID=A0A0W4ZCM3_PNEC8|nr:hypothetical protein T552_03055 [Pneumocystis carinii B80]KTW26164.1 hypothetical protein T552_03055 [Pneumocystis carinii B80]
MESSQIYLSSLYHRLPTTSAFDALTSDHTLSFISSSISALDKIFGGNGFKTGQITEISGPPGSGKTAIALQATINCIKKKEKILWIETFQPFPMHSLKKVITQDKKKETKFIDYTHEEINPLNYLTILHAPSLNNLIALFLHGYKTNSKDLIQQKKLIIIDDIATPIIAAFPTDNIENQSRNSTHDLTQLKKSQVLTNLLLSFNRIAAKNNACILILSKMVIKINNINGKECAILSSPLSSSWSQNCPNKIILLRKNIDILENENNLYNNKQVHFIYIQKVGGVTINSKTLIPFIITDEGIINITNVSSNVLDFYQIESQDKVNNTDEDENIN